MAQPSPLRRAPDWVLTWLNRSSYTVVGGWPWRYKEKWFTGGSIDREALEYYSYNCRYMGHGGFSIQIWVMQYLGRGRRGIVPSWDGRNYIYVNRE